MTSKETTVGEMLKAEMEAHETWARTTVGTVVHGKPVMVATLREAFAIVTRGMENWKGAIDVTIPTNEFTEKGITPAIIAAAVEFMTGSLCEVTTTLVGGMTTVRAAGYYSAVGA